jgi:hypothetical protein
MSTIYDAFPARTRDAGRPFKRDRLGGPWRPEDREKDLQACQDLLEGQFGEHINPMPGEKFEEARRRVGQIPINRFRRWLETVAATYSSPPFRTFKRNREPVPQDVADAVNEVYLEASIDPLLAVIDVQMAMTGNVLAAVGWSAERECITLALWPGGRFRAETGVDPASAFRYVCHVTEQTVMVWERQDTGWRFAVVAAGKEPDADTAWQTPDVPNPLISFAEQPQTNQTGFMVMGLGLPLGGLTIAMMCDGYNALGNIVAMQGFSTLVLYGTPSKSADGDDTITMGPANPLQFPPDSEQERHRAEYLTPDPRITETTELLDLLKREIQESFGIPATLWDAADDASGAQTEESRAPLVEYRKRRSQLFRLPERDLLRAVLAIAVKRGRLDASMVGDPKEWTVEVGFVDPMTEEQMEANDGRNGDGTTAGNEGTGDEAGPSGESRDEDPGDESAGE